MLFFIKRISIFSVYFCIVYLIFIFCISNLDFSKWSPLFKYTNIPLNRYRSGDTSLLRFKEINKFKNIDILFAGSSHCYRGFNTEYFKQFGLTCFNMGSISQSPLNTFFLLKKYIKNLNPKILVFEINPIVMRYDGTESFLDLIANTPLNFELLKMMFATKSIFAFNGILLYYFNIKRIPIQKLNANLSPTDIYFSGGFVKSTRIEFEPYLSREITYNFKYIQFDYISQILKMMNSKAKKVILVTTPMYSEYVRDIANYTEWSEKIHSLANDHDCIYIDFNMYPDLQISQLYYDEDHLNITGVNLFNTKFYNNMKDYIWEEIEQY
jgi:hypothetical protein